TPRTVTTTAPNPDTISAATATPDSGRYPGASVRASGRRTFDKSAIGGSPLRPGAGLVVGDVAERVEVRGFGLVGLAGLQVAFQVQIDLVLQDFLHDDRHPVPTLDFYERFGPRVQCDHSLLNQGRQLEAAAHLVHDPLFFQFIEHRLSSETDRRRSR